MLSRRLFIGCGLCAVSEFAATAVAAQTTPAGLKRTILQTIDGPAAGYQTVIVQVEIDANFVVPRHTHPGIESSYVLEGTTVLKIDGQPDRDLKAGDAFQVPAGQPHSAIAGKTTTRLLANYVVEKGKPLASPA
jgi:quercetin dioxygenase-like cupin family protein